jgi:acetyl-CoA carboxylase biotin carboxyl carrier protein
MTIEEIRDVIKILTETGVAEIEVQRGENRVWVKRAAQEVQVAVPVAAGPSVIAIPQGPTVSVGPSGPVAPPPDESMQVVRAPIVGTFYEAPSPGAPSFVKVGDTVQPGQVLCIIESMKLMNEIEAEASGVIVSQLVPNGKPVEYGEALFTFRAL